MIINCIEIGILIVFTVGISFGFICIMNSMYKSLLLKIEENVVYINDYNVDQAEFILRSALANFNGDIVVNIKDISKEQLDKIQLILNDHPRLQIDGY